MTAWDEWIALGWCQRDIELLRAHGTALGIGITVPEPPPKPFRPTYTQTIKPKKETPVAAVSTKTQNYINHIVMVLDASSSMGHLTPTVIKVVDGEIAHLAQRSKDLNQETRVTVYVFADKARCVIYDMDVLRLPSIKELYRPSGSTALIDATRLALTDLAMTPEKYGDHAFLAYVFTDGEENTSVGTDPYRSASTSELVDLLSTELNNLPDNWTVACLVPNSNGVFWAKKFGFPKDNIAVWDATSSKGMVEAGQTVRRATDTFMTNRASGIRSSRNVFSTGTDAVNAQSVAAAALKELPRGTYLVTHVPEKSVIKDFVEAMGHKYVTGKAFYELVKREEIQASKSIAIMNKHDDKVYTGDGTRHVLGLPDMNVRVSPDANPDYRIFVQSTSTNRVLPEHTKLLLITG